jgi:hypothetical protein
LRSEAQQVLDGLDSVERLDFRPALTTRLRDTAHINRILAGDNEIYMLNSKEGLVLRATLTSTGYALDSTFQCGPGAYEGYIVGAIISITALPPDNPDGATVLGIDSNGTLLYCIPGNSPKAVPPAPPGTNWGAPQSVIVDSNDLYILDPMVNAVWIYRGLDVTEQPRLFFGDQVPPMQDVIDMTINQNDLYLLHTDGHLTRCVFNGLITSPTRCQDPSNYTDARPGYQNAAVIPGTHFTEILFTPPPDPSIYLLEPEAQAIYHFGVNLTFQRQYQPLERLAGGPATAMAIHRGNRLAFLAAGSQVYYASLP